jgi:hypothetical protein
MFIRAYLHIFCKTRKKKEGRKKERKKKNIQVRNETNVSSVTTFFIFKT